MLYPDSYITYCRLPVVSVVNNTLQYTKTPEPWNSTINTTSLSPACPQHFGSMDYLTFHYPGFDLISEDCLYMNIYVPKVGVVMSDRIVDKLLVF